MDRTADELKQQLEMQREEVGRDLVVIGDRISPSRMAERGQARARRRITRAKDRVMGTVGSGRSAVGDTASGVASGVQGTAQGIAEGARQAPQQVTERVEGNPLSAGLVAFGIGLLAGSMLPGTRKEQELAQQAQPQLEHAATAAADAAKGVVEELKPAAQEEMGALREEARDAAQSTASTAKEHAQSARTEMAGSEARP